MSLNTPFTQSEAPGLLGAHRDIVFAYGALRSGTTVLRLMLNAHRAISNPGELDFLFDHIREDASHETGWRYDVQQLKLDRIFRASGLVVPDGLDGLDLLNDFLCQLKAQEPWKLLCITLHRHVDLIAKVLPQAHVLHLVRDPRDVARSTVRMGWTGTLSRGVSHWIETEQMWRQSAVYFAKDQVLNLKYETLMTTPETSLKSICAFFGVPFDPQMLAYHKHTSYDPPDPSRVAQWRRTCRPRELVDLEARAGTLMEQQGYVRSQPHTELSLTRSFSLTMRNKTFVWTFGMQRFGVLTYWAEKLTRWAGLATANRHLNLKMQAITTRNLK